MTIIADFFAPGIPKAQPRVKAFRRGKHSGVYTPETADEWKRNIFFMAQDPLHARRGEAGPYSMLLEFWFPRPKAHIGTKGLKLSAPVCHTAKPDVDNLAKAVMDVMTNLGVLDDDARVVSLTVTKAYNEENGGRSGCHIYIKKEARVQPGLKGKEL